MNLAHTSLLVAPRWAQCQEFAAWLFENDKNSSCEEGDG
jgi:hypothetical protein